MRTDRAIEVKPTLPTLGPAGSSFVDPTFGSPVIRITDGNTMPGQVGESFSTPSASHQLAWNADSTKFYVRGSACTCMPFSWDATNRVASRISGTGDGGLIIITQPEPQFSFVNPNVIYGARQKSVVNTPVVRKFDFSTGTYTDILDLATTVPNLANNTYCGGLNSSETLPERLAIFYAGGGQDAHFIAAIIEIGSSNLIQCDTLASTITRNGGTPVPTNITLGFKLHHVEIDRTGRWATLHPSTPYLASPHFKTAKYVWDLNTDIIVPMLPKPAAHTAIGWGDYINQDCCTSTAYDAIQLQYRRLDNVAGVRDIVRNVMTPAEAYLGSHISWNNAKADSLQPFAMETYRYNDGPFDVNPRNNVPWRPWDDEIISIQTENVGSTTTVWRHCHTRSTVWKESGPGTQFWYQPRCNISPDGRWILFTSNWEKTLGLETGGGGMFRGDVFMVESLIQTGVSSSPPGPVNTNKRTYRHATKLR